MTNVVFFVSPGILAPTDTLSMGLSHIVMWDIIRLGLYKEIINGYMRLKTGQLSDKKLFVMVKQYSTLDTIDVI